MMDFILTNAERYSVGYLPASATVDIDIGVDDDYNIVVPLSDYDPDLLQSGGYFFAPGTEYGGMLCSPSVDTRTNTISFSGDTFRGMLKRKITDPGSDNYLTLPAGTSRSQLTALVGQNSQFGSIYTYNGNQSLPEATTRWEPVLECINRICDYRDVRLDIIASESSAGTLSVSLELVSVPESDVEYSQDQGFEFKIQRVTDNYDYVIALGKGELAARTVVKYKINAKGKLSSVSSIPAGVSHRVYVYDYSGADNTNQLQKAAYKRMKEVNKKTEYRMTVPDSFEFGIGENIKGRDYVTGTTVSAYVSRKTIKIVNGVMTTSYELK